MASVNKVILIGHLTRDPELKFLPSQTAVCEFGMAMNRTWSDKDGTKKEEVTFVDCSAFGNQAETLSKYMTKGKPLYVEGRLKLDQWDAQDGSKRSKLRVIVDHFQFLGGKDDAAPAPAQQTAARTQPTARRGPPGKPADASMRQPTAAAQMLAPHPSDGPGVPDEDLPFAPCLI